MMKFEKCHGLGNDYVFVDQGDMSLEAAAAAAPGLCARGPGIGADGIVILGACRDGRLDMRMVNADGSEGLICGNAMRCVGLLAHRRRWLVDSKVVVDTAVGERVIEFVGGDGNTAVIRVDMGEAIVDEPVRLPGPAGDLDWHRVSTGNPHVVAFVENLDFDLTRWGPVISEHETFPDGVNANYSVVRSRQRIDSRIWERGSGPTLACGSGACAGFAAARQLGLVGDTATVGLPLGDLEMEWCDGSVLMTGPATWVFSAETPV